MSPAGARPRTADALATSLPGPHDGGGRAPHCGGARPSPLASDGLPGRAAQAYRHTVMPSAAPQPTLEYPGTIML